MKPESKKNTGKIGTRISTYLKKSLLVTGFPLLGMVTSYAVDSRVEDGANPIPANIVVENLSAPDAPKNDKTKFYWKDLFVKSGDTVGSILYAFGDDGKDAQKFIYSNMVPEHLLKMQIGQPVSVYTNNNNELIAMHFYNDNKNGEKMIVAIEKINGKWQAIVNKLKTETVETVKLIRVSTSAKRSLSQDAVPSAIQAALSSTFAGQLRLDDLQKGDVIRLIYESFFYQGQEIGTGNILAAEITKAGKNYSAYYFDLTKDTKDIQTGDYYHDVTTVTTTTQKGFEAIPVNNARVSSPFGVRRHPISGVYRMHTGIDYAAAAGTPIHAPAEAVIVERRVKGGYGNAIVLKHQNGLQTLYAHMSRFHPGLDVGQKIAYGTIIGYVGSTGRSTGPHLHYEVRMNGRPVNPVTSMLPVTNTLAANSELLAQVKATLELNKKLDLLKFDFPDSTELNKKLDLLRFDFPDPDSTAQKLSALKSGDGELIGFYKLNEEYQAR